MHYKLFSILLFCIYNYINAILKWQIILNKDSMYLKCIKCIKIYLFYLRLKMF